MAGIVPEIFPPAPRTILRFNPCRGTSSDFRATFNDFRATFNDFRATFNDFRATFNDFRATFNDFRATFNGFRAILNDFCATFSRCRSGMNAIWASLGGDYRRRNFDGCAGWAG